MNQKDGDRLTEALAGKALQRSLKIVGGALAITCVSLVCYWLGFKLLLVPAFIVLNAWLLPMPSIFTSWLGKLVMGFLVTMGLLQGAACLQFLLIPKSGFLLLAGLATVLHALVWVLAPPRPRPRIVLLSATDICAFVVVLSFLLPFTPILTGSSSILRIAQIGSLQAIDATNHYAAIAELTRAQHLNYASGYYAFPKSFHLAVGFIQDTLFKSQYSLGWRGNTVLYFGDYLFYGSLLGYLLYYVCIAFLKSLKEKLVPDGWAWSKLLVALCLAPPLALLYLLPFVSEGFLAYYYVCIAFVGGVLILHELRSSVHSKDSSVDLVKRENDRWWLLAYLIVIFGASATWPLLILPFLVCGLLFVLPAPLNWQVIRARLLTAKAWPVIAALALQLLPIYFQLKYASMSTSQSLNLTGGLQQFHPYLLLFGAVIIIVLTVRAAIEGAFQRVLLNIFLPLFAFLGLFMFFQYFTTGDILYYAVKVSLLIEMLLFAAGVAALIWIFASSSVYELRYAWLLPVLPMTIALMLISSAVNPLKDVRDLFRDRSHDVIPQYLSQDVATDVRLGAEGKIKHFNLMVLHYNPDQGKYFADMQVPYWADMMQYDASRPDFLAAQCIGRLYSNLAFGAYSADEQRAMIKQLRLCATNVRSRGETFYIVTDPVSAPHVRGIIGNVATVVLD